MKQLLRAAGLPLDGLEMQFGANYVVAEAGDTLIGVAGVERYAGDGLLRSAAVAPEWRRRGVGKALARDRIAWARGHGIDTLYLLTTTAAQFFQSLGFVPVSRDTAPAGIRASREFAEACPASAAFMRMGFRAAHDDGEALQATGS